MFSIKIKIDCFTATLCSIIIVTDKLIIIIYFLIFEDKNNLCEVFTPNHEPNHENLKKNQKKIKFSKFVR
jgi:hypothetical protein